MAARQLQDAGKHGGSVCIPSRWFSIWAQQRRPRWCCITSGNPGPSPSTLSMVSGVLNAKSYHINPKRGGGHFTFLPQGAAGKCGCPKCVHSTPSWSCELAFVCFTHGLLSTVSVALNSMWRGMAFLQGHRCPSVVQRPQISWHLGGADNQSPACCQLQEILATAHSARAEEGIPG